MNCLPLQDHLLLLVTHLWVLNHPVSLPPLLLSRHVCVTCLTLCAIQSFTMFLCSNSTLCQCSSCCWSCFYLFHHCHCCSHHCADFRQKIQAQEKFSWWGWDYTVDTTGFCLLLLFSIALIDHVYWTHTTKKNRFVLSHMHVQNCQLTTCSFNFAAWFFYSHVEKKDLKVKLKHSTVYCITLHCQN